MSELANLIFSKINEFSNEDAIKNSEKSMSYKSLNDISLVYASLINSLKNKDNDIVGVFGQRNFSSYISILSSLYSGCYYTPFNSRQKQSFVKNLIEELQIKIFLTDEENLPSLNKILSSVNKPFQFYIVLTDKPYFFINGNDKKELFKDLKIQIKPNNAKDTDLVYILYTSGSTGKPKGVQISHLNLFSWICNMNIEYNIGKDDNISQNYDLTFDLSVSDTFLAWSNGATLCILSDEEKMTPFDYILREKITVWGSTPTIVSFLKNIGFLDKNIFPNIRLTFFCGEALTQETANAWQEACPNSTIVNFYGPTEATIWISKFTYNLSDKSKSFLNSIIPIGIPFRDHEFRIIDDQNNLVTNGEKGEIVYKGPQISIGYKNNITQTNKVFKTYDWDKTNDIWYSSGDLGYCNNEGDFEFIGRKDNQIKLGGRRIEINEIEFYLLKCSKFDNVIVVPVRDQNNLCKFLVAFVSIKLSIEEIDEIRTKFEEHLDSIFFPREFKFLEKYPVNSSGKTDRKLLENQAMK